MSFSTGRDDVVLCGFAPDAIYRMQVRPTLDSITSTSCLPLVEVAFTSRFHMPTSLRFQCRRSAFSSLLFIELRPYFRRCTPQRVSVNLNSTRYCRLHFRRSSFPILLPTELPTVITLRSPTPQGFHSLTFFFTFYRTLLYYITLCSSPDDVVQCDIAPSASDRMHLHLLQILRLSACRFSTSFSHR
jgi:hypothetical protein